MSAYKIRPFTIAVVGLILYFLPFIFSGSDSNFAIHDNLDNNFVRYKILNDEGKTFTFNPNAEVESMMSGLPRMYFTSGLNFFSFLFLVVSPIAAYLINFVLVHCLAFAGMYLLLKKHVMDERDELLNAFISLCFSLLPFYTIYGFTVAGLPILAFAFLNLIKETRNRFDYWIIIIFALNSSFMLVGIFVIGCLVIWGVVEYKNKSVLNKAYLKGVVILFGTYFILNVHVLVQLLIGAKVPSHRVEFIPEAVNFETVIDRSVSFFNDLHYHASPSLGFLLLPVLLAVLFGILREHRYTTLLGYLLLANIGIAFIYGVSSWEILNPVWAAIPITKQFQWNRFYYLSPFIWFMQFSIALKILKDCITIPQVSRMMFYGIGFYVLFFIWKYNTEFRETSSNLVSDLKTGWSFRQFFDEELFTQIKSHINKPVSEYRVASLGIHPAVSLYNGMHTIDGYLPSYPLAYKHEFRKIIAEEIEKPDGFQTYFDQWGSRCYLFSTDLGYNFTVDKSHTASLNDLRFDFSAGPKVDYILSAASIANPKSLGLRLEKVFENEHSRWRIHLYQVDKNFTKKATMISLTARIPADDEFTIFYTTPAIPDFDERQTISKVVRGSNEFQVINFSISDTLEINRLRLDLGTNDLQDTIAITEIKFIKDNVVKILSLDHFETNGFIERAGNRFKTRVVSNRYDPYGEFRGNVLDLLRELQSKTKLDLN